MASTNIASRIADHVNRTEDLSDALKDMAADPVIREAFGDSPELRDLLLPAACRYVVGETRSAVISAAERFIAGGYRVSAEFMGGEDTSLPETCTRNRDEICALIREIGHGADPTNICFDLSTIGLSLSEGLALENLAHILEEAESRGCRVLLSMEEPSKVGPTLAVIDQALQFAPNIGATLQAYMSRTGEDLERLAPRLAVLRLVKGVYGRKRKTEQLAGAELFDRMLELVQRAAGLRDGRPLLVGTHDPRLIETLCRWFPASTAPFGFEMLHGVRPEALAALRRARYSTCIYLAYGSEWLIHFVHRLAEHTPNVVLAAIDVHTRRACSHPYLDASNRTSDD